MLILDEPATGLDPKARVELKDLIRQLNRDGKTVFITSHVLSDLQEICTSLGILEQGKLLKVGKIGDVMRSASTARRVRLRLAAAGFDLRQWLEDRAVFAEVHTDFSVADFAFPGTDADLAALIKGLVQAGAPLCGVEEKTDSLEEIYSKIYNGKVT